MRCYLEQRAEEVWELCAQMLFTFLILGVSLRPALNHEHHNDELHMSSLLLPLPLNVWVLFETVRGLLAQPVCTTHNKHKKCFCSALLLRLIVRVRSGRGTAITGVETACYVRFCLDGQATQMWLRLGNIMISGWRVERAGLEREVGVWGAYGWCVRLHWREGKAWAVTCTVDDCPHVLLIRGPPLSQ